MTKAPGKPKRFSFMTRQAHVPDDFRGAAKILVEALENLAPADLAQSIGNLRTQDGLYSRKGNKNSSSDSLFSIDKALLSCDAPRARSEWLNHLLADSLPERASACAYALEYGVMDWVDPLLSSIPDNGLDITQMQALLSDFSYGSNHDPIQVPALFAQILKKGSLSATVLEKTLNSAASNDNVALLEVCFERLPSASRVAQAFSADRSFDLKVAPFFFAYAAGAIGATQWMLEHSQELREHLAQAPTQDWVRPIIEMLQSESSRIALEPGEPDYISSGHSFSQVSEMITVLLAGVPDPEPLREALREVGPTLKAHSISSLAAQVLMEVDTPRASAHASRGLRL